jgi:hypothetical protein
VNVNDEPPDCAVNDDNMPPTFVFGVKSDVNPVVASIPVIDVMVQLMAPPTRIGLVALVHDSTDVDVGFPNTVYVIGLLASAWPEQNALIWKFVVAVSGAFNVNVNDEPPPTELRPVIDTPPTDVTE